VDNVKSFSLAESKLKALSTVQVIVSRDGGEVAVEAEVGAVGFEKEVLETVARVVDFPLVFDVFADNFYDEDGKLKDIDAVPITITHL
jgi:phage tail tube protein FII